MVCHPCLSRLVSHGSASSLACVSGKIKCRRSRARPRTDREGDGTRGRPSLLREREREGGRGGERECRSVGEAHPRVRGADLLRCVVPTVHVVDLPLWESLLDSSHHGGQGLVGGLLPRRRRGLAQSRHLSSREEGLDLARSARLNSGSPARHKRHTCAQGLLPLALFGPAPRKPRELRITRVFSGKQFFSWRQSGG